MARLCAVLVVAVPLANAAIVFGEPEQVVDFLPARTAIKTLDEISRLPVLAIILLFSLPILWGLLQLRRLFLCYAKGEIFSRTAAHYLSRFALALLLDALATILTKTTLIWFLTRHNPPGERYYIISIGSPEVATAFVGAIFMIIAWVLGEAAAVAEDHRGFV